MEGEKRKGKMGGEERVRKDSTSSVGSSAGSLENFWGKKREREEENEGMLEEKGVFKRSGRTKRSPEKEGKRVGKDGGEEGEGLVGMIREMVMEMRRMREDMKKDREERKEIKEEIRKERVEMKKEREERRRMEEEWRGERKRWEEDMREERRRRVGLLEKLGKLEEKERRMEEVIGKVEKWEKEAKGVERGDKEVTGNEEEWKLRVRRIEVVQDKKERERKRCNVVVRGMAGEGSDVKAEVGRVWERMGLGTEGIKEVVRLGRAGAEGGGMVLVRLEGREEKRKVMEAKSKLRGRKERVEDDLTEEERRARWKIEREAQRERERGRRMRVGYMKMWVDGKVRRWDEIKEKWCEEQGNE